MNSISTSTLLIRATDSADLSDGADSKCVICLEEIGNDAFYAHKAYDSSKNLLGKLVHPIHATGDCSQNWLGKLPACCATCAVPLEGEEVMKLARERLTIVMKKMINLMKTMSPIGENVIKSNLSFHTHMKLLLTGTGVMMAGTVLLFGLSLGVDVNLKNTVTAAIPTLALGICIVYAGKKILEGMRARWEINNKKEAERMAPHITALSEEFEELKNQYQLLKEELAAELPEAPLVEERAI